MAASLAYCEVPAGFDPAMKDGRLDWFTLNESRGDVVKRLGPPKLVLDVGQDLESWQYEVEPSDEEEPSHILVFRKSKGKLISVTRSFAPERLVDEWFSSNAKPHYYPDAEKPALRVRMEKLTGDRMWIAIGSDIPGRVVGQVLLIEEKELPRFYPWLANANW